MGLTQNTPPLPQPQEVQEGEKEKKDEEKEKEKKKEAEPNFQLLENPARVMPAQLKVLTMPESCRYQPFKPVIIHKLTERMNVGVVHKVLMALHINT